MSGDAELVAAFETGRVAAGRDDFHHADHVHVAWTYLGRLPLLSAAETFVTNLKRFAAAGSCPKGAACCWRSMRETPTSSSH